MPCIDDKYLQMPGHENYLSELPKIAEKIPKGAGIILQSSSWISIIGPHFEAFAKKVPDDIGIIGMQIDDGGQSVITDSIYISCIDIYKQAIQEAVSDNFTGIKKLVKPVLKKIGSMRG